MELIIVLIGILLSMVGVVLLLFTKNKFAQTNNAIVEAERAIAQAKKDIDTERREAMIKLKDELYKRRSEFDIEAKREYAELERFQAKLNARYESIENKELRYEELRKELQNKEKILLKTSDQLHLHEARLKSLHEELVSQLESITSMTQEEARQVLFKNLESEVRHTQEKWIQKIEEEARNTAKEKAINIVIGAMQRHATE